MISRGFKWNITGTGYLWLYLAGWDQGVGHEHEQEIYQDGGKFEFDGGTRSAIGRGNVRLLLSQCIDPSFTIYPLVMIDLFSKVVLGFRWEYFSSILQFPKITAPSKSRP
jgi:hypothetical protein